MFSLGYNKFLVQVNYKSGNSMKFWCYNFHLSNGSVSWQNSTQVTPLRIGLDEFESAWVVKTTRGLLGQKKEK